jgi:PAS domain S-box-containing protein
MDTRPTVVLVEDDADTFNMITALLEDGGYRVVGGGEGYAIPGLLNNEPLPEPGPSLVVLDDRLPGVRGLSLCSMLKDHPYYQDVPVMMITAHARNEEDELEGIKAGSLEYLRKPFDTRLFMAKVDNLVETGGRLRSLHESEEEALSLWESHPDTIFTLDEGGDVREVTPNLQRNLGLTLHDVLGQPFLALFSNDTMTAVQQALADAQQGHGGHVTGSLAMLSPRPYTGSRPVAITLIPVDKAKPPFLFAVVRDITQETQRQCTFCQSEKLSAVGRLTHGIAHNYNNLLTGILGQAQLIVDEAERHGGLSSIVESAQEIVAEATRGGQLANHLLRISEPRAGRIDRINLNQTVDQVTSFLAPIYASRVEINVQTHEQALPVEMDGAALYDALLNLCVNALEASAPGDTVTVRTAPRTLTEQDCLDLGRGAPGRYHTVEVIDHGRGMDEATQAQLFVPFFTTKFPAVGTGLGLASVYGAITAARGMLIVRSKPDAGTAITVALPAAT